jgi:hypothetical protein
MQQAKLGQNARFSKERRKDGNSKGLAEREDSLTPVLVCTGKYGIYRQTALLSSAYAVSRRVNVMASADKRGMFPGNFSVQTVYKPDAELSALAENCCI